MVFTTQLLENLRKPVAKLVREFQRDYPRIPGGLKYYGFKYYPREPNFKDPPYQPEKLFLVRRCKPVKGSNPVERYALQSLNIDGDINIKGHIAIVKNIPEVNKYLYKIKHMVEILPIKIVNGLPEEDNYDGAWLRSNGEFTVAHKLKPAQECVQAAEEFQKSPVKFNAVVLKKYLRDRWNNPLAGGLID